MQVSLTPHQAALILVLIRRWASGHTSEYALKPSLNDALDALQITLALSEGMGKDLLTNSPDLAADIQNYAGITHPLAPKGDDVGPLENPDPIGLDEMLQQDGEFMTCKDKYVTRLQAMGYTVTRDYVLGTNFVSPPTYCVHGRAFNSPCEFCDAHDNKIMFGADADPHADDCPHCSGTGFEGNETCMFCAGTGKKTAAVITQDGELHLMPTPEQEFQENGIGANPYLSPGNHPDDDAPGVQS